MKISDSIEKVIYDQNAETAGEIVSKTLISREAFAKMCVANIKAGKWEQVWKKHNGRTVKAYRRAK